MLYELDKREKEAGIVPDAEVDLFMKVSVCCTLLIFLL